MFASVELGLLASGPVPGVHELLPPLFKAAPCAVETKCYKIRRSGHSAQGKGREVGRGEPLTPRCAAGEVGSLGSRRAAGGAKFLSSVLQEKNCF